MGKLTRLTEKIVNVPHLITATALESSLSYLQERNEGEVQLAILGGTKKDAKRLPYNPDTGIGVLSVDGPLTYIEYMGLCGESPTSYQKLQTEFEAMVEAGAKTIVMDLDSPGGEAYGCFETAETLRKLADDNGVKLIAYVDGLAASAGYGLASAAHEIVVNPMGEVGSIGVVVSLANVSKAEKSIGIERTYIYAGESKVPFDSDGNFTEGFLSGIQEKVDSLYESFIGHVAGMRGIESDVVRNTKAQVFTADKALELGLVDKIMSRSEFFTYLNEVVKSEESMSLTSKLLKSKSESNTDMSTLEELQAELTTALAGKEEATAQLAAMASEVAEKTTALEAALARVAEFEAAAAVAQEQAALAAKAARKEKLEAAVGSAKAETLFAKFEALDEDAFASVVETLAEANKALDDSPAFKELGASGEGKPEDHEAASLSLVGEMIKNQRK